MNTLRISTTTSEGLNLEACDIGGAIMVTVLGPLPQSGAFVLSDDDARTMAACIMEWTENRPEGA